MTSVMRFLDTIKEKVDETKNDMFSFLIEGEEQLSEIETPVLDSLLEDIVGMIEDRKNERQSEREKALHEKRMRGDWS